jgi:L-amino acid N-acyltransferase YncA
MRDAITIRMMTSGDWPLVCAIYEEGIATGNATFQMDAPSWETWDAGHLRQGRLVALEDGTVRGWGALSPVSSRPVYAGVAEVSIYVAGAMRGRGIGGLLLAELVAESERSGIWTLQAGIFPENEGSLALHQRCGFRIVGRREKLGEMHGRWRDVLLLERRSREVGVAEAGSWCRDGDARSCRYHVIEACRKEFDASAYPRRGCLHHPAR